MNFRHIVEQNKALKQKLILECRSKSHSEKFNRKKSIQITGQTKQELTGTAKKCRE